MALIPEWFLDSVVAFGAVEPGENGPTKRVFATGFYYGLVSDQKAGETESLPLYPPVPGDERPPEEMPVYHLYLVTNRHVADAVPDLAFVRTNILDSTGFGDYPMATRTPDGWPTFVAHPDPNVDVAVTTVSTKKLATEGRRVSFFQSDAQAATREQLRTRGVMEGDGVYVLGFPLGLVEEPRHTPITRGGVIARMRDTYAGARNEFLIDAPVFPGNSGGPVLLRPEGLAVMGTKSQRDALLIGIVNSYVPYIESAFSAQTGMERDKVR